jgi:hypothetical protein
MVVVDRIAVWAGNIPDELWPAWGGFAGLEIVFAVDGGEGAEELVGDVSEDSGAARGDAVLREEDKELGEEVVDVVSGIELGGIGGEGGGEIGGGLILHGTSVFGAEAGGVVRARLVAPASGAGVVLATWEAAGGARLSGLVVHDTVPF